jgi:hypothetical protein
MSTRGTSAVVDATGESYPLPVNAKQASASTEKYPPIASLARWPVLAIAPTPIGRLGEVDELVVFLLSDHASSTHARPFCWKVARSAREGGSTAWYRRENALPPHGSLSSSIGP